MLSEFIDFVNSVLPSVSPDFRDGAKNAITQFEKEGHQIKYLLLNPLKELSQGDVLSKIPFCYFEENGKQKTFVSDALVLSTSCNIDNKSKIVLVPVLPIDAFEGNKNSIAELKKNTVFDYMYIPDEILTGKFIDFEIMNTYSKDLIMSGINSGKVRLIISLCEMTNRFKAA